MRSVTLFAASAALSVVAAPAMAATVFTEDFSGATVGEYGPGVVPGTAFTVAAGGQVDIFGQYNVPPPANNPFPGAVCVANPTGNCLDLIGQNGPGTTLNSTNAISLVSGTSYTISFSDIVQGYDDPRYPAFEDFTVSLGDFSQRLTSTSAATPRTLSFVATTTSLATLSFTQNTGPVNASGAPYNDSVHGVVLSKVGVDAAAPPTMPSAVPEPATWAMTILGFGLVGGALRRHAGTSLVAG